MLPPEEAEAGPGPQKPEAETCYRCHTRLAEGARHCPRCGRPQFRVCFCGSQIPITARACPSCGADWSQAARVRRRSHHARLDRASLGKYSLAGGALALVAAAVINVLVRRLARTGLPAGQVMPHDFLAKLHLAGLGVAIAWGHLGQRLQAVMGGLGPALGALVLGGLIGAVVYLSKKGLITLPFRRRHHRRSGSHPPPGSS